ncbi:MAG: beta-galactosidase, partial [Flavobacterium sp.]
DYKNQAPSYIYRGQFDLKNITNTNIINFYYKKIGTDVVIFINGNKLAASAEDPQKYILNTAILKEGKNTIQIVATPLQRIRDWDVMNTDPGIIQVITPSEPWKRKLFNGYAQVIVQKDGSGNDVVLSASAKGLKSETLVLKK